MTRDEVLALAREAGFIVDELSRQHQPNCINHTWHMIDEGLSRFAALVAAQEREECAKLAEDFAVDLEDVWVCEKLADAIRSRT